MNRQAFEAYIRADSTLSTARDDDNEYIDTMTAVAWHVWQAASKHAADTCRQLIGVCGAAGKGAQKRAAMIALDSAAKAISGEL